MYLSQQLGLGDWSSSTICSLIPSGDPYRMPGNQCSSNGVQYTFDGSGNIVTMTGAATALDSSGNIIPAPPTIGSQIMSFFGVGGSASPLIPGMSSTPSWLPYVAIGGLGIAAVLLLSKPKATVPALTSNPGRRRRRARRHRR